MKYTILLLIISTILLFVSSCETAKKGTVQKYEKTEMMSYEGVVKSIISNYCITCHSGASPRADLDLTTYENVRKAAEKGPLLVRINSTSQPMPQSGLLPKSIRKTIQEWASGGYIREGEATTDQSYVILMRRKLNQ